MTKVVVLNVSGNTGKTTLSKHLLAPLLNARRVQIEDINAGDGQADAEVQAKQFAQLAAEINVLSEEKNIVLDVGSSTAGVMLGKFQELRTTRREIDYWVVPCVPSTKVVMDTVNTIRLLTNIGVPANQIIVIKNNVTDTYKLEKDFEAIDKLAPLGIHIADQAVLNSDVFEMLKGDERNVISMSDNPPDFKAMKREAAGDEDKLRPIGVKILLQDMAEKAAENLRSVFNSTPLAA